MRETILSAIENCSLDVPEEIHSEEYGSSEYTRLYIKPEVSRLDNALEDKKLKTWAFEQNVQESDGNFSYANEAESWQCVPLTFYCHDFVLVECCQS